ncbi:MAG: hypothetical protein ACRC1P_09980 [Cellulosilyticaceae bacterium]
MNNEVTVYEGNMVDLIKNITNERRLLEAGVPLEAARLVSSGFTSLANGILQNNKAQLEIQDKVNDIERDIARGNRYKYVEEFKTLDQFVATYNSNNKRKIDGLDIRYYFTINGIMFNVGTGNTNNYLRCTKDSIIPEDLSTCCRIYGNDIQYKDGFDEYVKEHYTEIKSAKKEYSKINTKTIDKNKRQEMIEVKRLENLKLQAEKELEKYEVETEKINDQISNIEIAKNIEIDKLKEERAELEKKKDMVRKEYLAKYDKQINEKLGEYHKDDKYGNNKNWEDTYKLLAKKYYGFADGEKCNRFFSELKKDHEEKFNVKYDSRKKFIVYGEKKDVEMYKCACEVMRGKKPNTSIKYTPSTDEVDLLSELDDTLDITTGEGVFVNPFLQ